MSIEIDNDASSEYTRLKIRSQDTHGFLFSFTNALAVLNVNVVGAEIRTVGAEAQDTFRLTDQAGHKIQSEGQIQELRRATALIKQFTHLLPLSPNPAQAVRQFSSSGAPGAFEARMDGRPAGPGVADSSGDSGRAHGVS